MSGVQRTDILIIYCFGQFGHTLNQLVELPSILAYTRSRLRVSNLIILKVREINSGNDSRHAYGLAC